MEYWVEVLIAPMLFIIIYIAIIYIKLEEIESPIKSNKKKDEPLDNTIFPKSDYVSFKIGDDSFRGYVMIRGYSDESIPQPILVMKGYFNDLPVYLYIEGEVEIEEIEFVAIDEDISLKELEVDSSDVVVLTYDYQENRQKLLKLDNEDDISIAKTSIEGMQSIYNQLEADKLESNQEYKYNFEDKSIKKIGFLHKFISLPYRFYEHLVDNSIGWGFLGFIFVTIIASLYFFEIESSLQAKEHLLPWDIKSSLFIGAYIITLLYFVVYYLYKKDYWNLFVSPIIAVVVGFAINVPITMALYYMAFELNKKPFETTVLAMQEYEIYFAYESHTKHNGNYKGRYVLNYLRYYNSNKEWQYSKKMVIKQPQSPYPKDVEKELFENSKKQLEEIQEKQGITKCEHGCHFISPCNRLSIVKLIGEESLGEVSIKGKYFQNSESLCDNISYQEYWKTYASALNHTDIGVMIVAKNDKRFDVGKSFLQMGGTGMAYKRNTTNLIVDKVRYKQDQFLSFEKLKEIFGFNDYEVSLYQKEMKLLHISNQDGISTIPFYYIDKEMAIDWSVLDRDRYKVIRIQRVGLSRDRMVSYYMVIATLSDYWPEHWMFKKDDPYFNDMLPKWF